MLRFLIGQAKPNGEIGCNRQNDSAGKIEKEIRLIRMEHEKLTMLRNK